MILITGIFVQKISPIIKSPMDDYSFNSFFSVRIQVVNSFVSDRVFISSDVLLCLLVLSSLGFEARSVQFFAPEATEMFFFGVHK